MMRFLVPIALLALAGCDPSGLGNTNSRLHDVDALVQNPLCVVLCNTSVDNIGETNARDVDNFTGQTSTRTNTNTAPGGNQ